MDGQPYLRRLLGASYTYAGLTPYSAYYLLGSCVQVQPILPSPRWTPVTSDVCYVHYVYVGLEVLGSTETIKTRLTLDFLPLEMASMYVCEKDTQTNAFTLEKNLHWAGWQSH